MINDNNTSELSFGIVQVLGSSMQNFITNSIVN